MLPSLPPELEALTKEWTIKQQQQAKEAFFEDHDLSFSLPALQPSIALPCTDDSHPKVFELPSSLLVTDNLEYVGGLDISFREDGGGDGTEAIAVLAVLNWPDLRLVHGIVKEIKLDVPYVPSFLSFREAPHYLVLVEECQRLYPKTTPQVLFVDGNARLHVRQAGNAVSVGLETGIPTLGVAKEFHPYLHESTEAKQSSYLSSQKLMREASKTHLPRRGTWLGIPGLNSPDEFWGAALRTSPDRKSTNPVFVSPGHRLSLETSMALTMAACVRSRVPEPIKLADSIGRHEAQRVWGKK